MEDKSDSIPLEINDFKVLREQELIYVDKTHFISSMLTSGIKNWLLLKPRKFGKTLFLSTLENYFAGNQGFFKGLSIQDKGDFKKYPVIRLDMSILNGSIDELKEGLITLLHPISKREEIILKTDNPTYALFGMVHDLKEKYNENVVVLIDDYDRTIIDRIEDAKRITEYKVFLSDLFNALQSVKGDLHLVLVTGLSSIGRHALRQHLPDISDISCSLEYGQICGYTEQELTSYFNPFLDGLLEKMVSIGFLEPNTDKDDLLKFIAKKYGGFSWDGVTRVLNPYSVNRLMHEKVPEGFWQKTMKTHFITKLIAKDPYSFILPHYGEGVAYVIDEDDIENLTPEAVMFEAGFLTVDKIASEDPANDSKVKAKKVYELKVPNEEVSSILAKGMFGALFPWLEGNKSKISFYKSRIMETLETKDAKDFADIIHSVFSKMALFDPSALFDWSLGDKTRIKCLYYAALKKYFELLGFTESSDHPNEKECTNITIIFPDKTYAIFELDYLSLEDGEESHPEKLAKRIETGAESLVEDLKKNAAPKYKDIAKAVITAGIIFCGGDNVFVKF
ncbi:MAG: AAA family ATPase [Deltaproteobacteria bacterium]|jgi:hypothetical protein|nr:AAA family ATPase [Deltaproteobacteria bacterium]